jgi:hypothetical protein
MRFIITVIVALLLTACTTTSPSPESSDNNQSKSIASTVPHELQPEVQTSLPDSSEFTEYNNFEANITSHDYDIEGRYKLRRGLYMHGGQNRGEIVNAYLVIEKLDDNNFGYYYADKTAKLPPNSTFGIFYYDKEAKKFHQKIIDGNSLIIRKGGINIIKDGDRLKITIRQSPGRKIIIWEKTEQIDIEQALLLDNAIEEARDSYVQVYQKNFEKLSENEGSFFGFF